MPESFNTGEILGFEVIIYHLLVCEGFRDRNSKTMCQKNMAHVIHNGNFHFYRAYHAGVNLRNRQMIRNLQTHKFDSRYNK